MEGSNERNNFNNTDVIKIMLCDAGYKPVVFAILAAEIKKIVGGLILVSAYM